MRKTSITLSLAMLFAGPATADELSDLRQQVQVLQQRLERLEAEERQQKEQADRPPAASQAVTAGDVRGSFKLPGSNTSVAIGGYVKGVAIHSSASAGPNNAGDELLIPSTIPVGDAPIENKIKLHARESRLNIRTHTSTPYGAFTTLIEGDFFGASGSEVTTNGHGMRLRHAWATLGNLGVGQFWGNLLNLTAVPETLDFAPQQGSLGAVRQSGFRWTSPLANGFWSVALENPESFLSGLPNPTPDADRFPDLSAKIHFKAPVGEYEVGGLVRRLKSDLSGVDDASAYAVAFSGVVPLFGKDDFKFQVAYGDGGGRYLGGLGAVTDAALVAGDLKTIKTVSGYVGYRHHWTPNLRSTLAYSWIDARNPSGAPGTLLDRFWSSHVNLIWTPLPNVDLGVEYLHAYRRLENRLHGDLDRVIVSGKYSF